MDIRIFKNSQFGEVRVTEIEGKTCFVGIDVARILGYADPKGAISRHCKVALIQRLSDNQGVPHDYLVIPEGDIYRLAAKSQLPGAEAFESWIFDEVLPAIHKHGGYLTPEKIEEAIMNPDVIIRLATALKEEKQKRLEAETKVIEQAPKAKHYDDVLSSDNLMSVTEIAKNYGMAAVALNEILHAYGVQYKKGKHWIISAEYQDRDYIRIVPAIQYSKDGKNIFINQMKWTESGRKFIHDLLVEKGLINRQKCLAI